MSVSDLHIDPTVPFLLACSVLNALSCECPVLGSDTAPMREVIETERIGLLAGFFEVEALAAQAHCVLKDPAAY